MSLVNLGKQESNKEKRTRLLEEAIKASSYPNKNKLRDLLKEYLDKSYGVEED